MSDPSPHTAFDGLLPQPAPIGDVRLNEWRGAIAMLMMRKGKADALAGRLSPPRGPKALVRDGLTFVATSPDSWLVLKDEADATWARDFAVSFGDLASVSDLSGSYGVLHLTGAGARDLLQRGVPIDLHPSTFPPGSAAVSLIAHVDVVLWADPAGDGFFVAVFRSYAASFMHWLTTAAESGGITLG